EIEDPIAHQHLAEVRLGGQPLCELERVARRQEPHPSARLPADHDLALVDADRGIEREPAQPEAARLAHEIVRTRERAIEVVLARAGHTEQHRARVVLEPLEESSEAIDHLADAAEELEVPPDEILGLTARRELGEAGQL